MRQTSDDFRSAASVLQGLRRWWWVAVLSLLLGTAGGLSYAYNAPEQYTGSVTMVVELPKGVTDTEALVRTVEALITSSAVLSDVSEAPGVGLGAREVEDHLEVERPTGSAVLEVTASGEDVDETRALATAVVPALKQRIAETRGQGGSQDKPAANERNKQGKLTRAAKRERQRLQRLEERSVQLRVVSLDETPRLAASTPEPAQAAALGAGAGGLLGLLVVTILVSSRPEQPRRERRS